MATPPLPFLERKRNGDEKKKGKGGKKRGMGGHEKEQRGMKKRKEERKKGKATAKEVFVPVFVQTTTGAASLNSTPWQPVQLLQDCSDVFTSPSSSN